MSQISRASLDFTTKGARATREAVLAETAAIVPRETLKALIEPHIARPA